MLSRRNMLQAGALLGTGLVLPWSFRQRAYAQTVPLLSPPPPGQRFVNLLPRPDVLSLETPARVHVDMGETTQWLGLVDAAGAPLETTVWGYGRVGRPVSYPGPTLEAWRDRVSRVTWSNKLPEYPPPQSQAHLLPVDTSIHLARPERFSRVGVPTVVHLHGGHTVAGSDGYPDAWFTRNFKEVGPFFSQEWRSYRYDNDQEAATLWYHDHALGITRLNVYTGLAGFYLLRDDNEARLVVNNVLPSGPYEVPILVQDRMFTAQGQLFYPAQPPAGTTAVFPSVLPEFFGDFILVNGMAWPKLDVEPRQYRFRLLNGSDSRFYRFFFDPILGGRVFEIGTDTGLLNHPVLLDEPFVLAPGERRDVVIDFTGLTGSRITLKNDAPTPFPDGDPLADDDPTRDILRIDVSLPLDTGVPLTEVRKAFPGGSVGTLRPVNGPIQPLSAVRTRKLLLFEGTDRFGRLMPLLGAEGQPNVLETLLWDEPITENPGLGDVEIWEIYNVTMDAHPIHIHLVSFQILGRAPMEVPAAAIGSKSLVDPMTGQVVGTGGTLDLSQVLVGAFSPPPADEQGPKDTVQSFPGEVTRVIARFDRPGRYVWHCHILSHEDHEMMRPFHVGP